MKTRASILAIALGVAAIGAVAAVQAGCRQSHAASQAAGKQAPAGQVWLTPAQVKEGGVEVETVSEQDVEDTILTSGVVALEDTRTGHVFSPVSGRVVKILAEFGARVKKGEPLALIESPDIGSAVSDVHKAEAALIAAEHDLNRKRDLLIQHAASEADVETAEDTFRSAKAELERARQKQYLLHVGNVDAVTQTYTLTSPVDGEVLMRNINPGAEVQGQYSGGATQELFTIGELDHVWVFGDVYESDLARVHVGAKADVTVLARPGQSFHGQVDWVSGMLDPNTRTAKIRSTFDNQDRLLRPLMYATVRVGVDQRHAVAIRPSSVVRLGDYKLVFVQSDAPREDPHDEKVIFERLPVEIDERGVDPDAGIDREAGGAPPGAAPQWIEVKHGLEAGQRVVVRGTTFLSQKL
jgi:cobalt-zinc-cadmium efflux system membrane fusion protein